MAKERDTPLRRFLEAELKRLDKNWSWLATKCGVSTAAVAKWPNTGQISRENIPKVAAALGRSIEEVYAAMTGTSPLSNVRIAEPVPRYDEVQIKESEVRFRGGPGHDLEYDEIEESEPATYRLSWFHKERIKPKDVVRFRHSGDSNEPFLFSGDTILVNRAEREIRNGKVYAFWQQGEGRRCKKLFLKPNGTLIIKSFNQDYPDEELPAERMAEEIVIIGRVRDKSGRGGL